MKIIRPEEVTTFPEFRAFSPEELKEAYALARAAFTTDDLQRYTEVEEGIAADELLAELEEIQTGKRGWEWIPDRWSHSVVEAARAAVPSSPTLLLPRSSQTSKRISPAA